jgi:hypothetical protein
MIKKNLTQKEKERRQTRVDKRSKHQKEKNPLEKRKTKEVKNGYKISKKQK